MTTVRLSRDAADYVRQETEYLRRRNPAAAANFLQAMKNARRTLQDFPAAGPRTTGLSVAGSHRLVAGDYILDYIYDGTDVAVILIRHGRIVVEMPELDSDPEA